ADSYSHAYAVAGNLGRDRARTSSALISWFRAHVHTGLFLQCDLFHLRAGSDAVLRRGRAECGWLSLAVCVGKCARAIAPRTSVRHNRTQTDDYCYLWARRHFTRAERLAFSRGRAHSTNADACVDDYFFHRVGGGELGVPNRERNFSAGNPRAGNRDFLRGRDAGWRSRRTNPIRTDYWHGLEHGIVCGIFAGCGVDDFRGDR